MDDRRLIQDTLLLLKQQLSPEADIRLNPDDRPLHMMAGRLQACQLPYARKIVIMGCYYLLHLAITRHYALHDPDAAGIDRRNVTKAILDGDYALGVYFRFAVEMKEHRLILHLTSAFKNIQIGLIHGTLLDEALCALPEQIISFLQKEQTEHSGTGGDTDEAA